MNDGVEFDQSIDAQHSGCANCPTTATTTSCTLCACTAVCYFHPPHPAASVTAAWCHLCVDVGTVLQRWCAEPQTVDGMYDKSVDWNPSSIRQCRLSTSDGSTILTVATVLDDAIALERESLESQAEINEDCRWSALHGRFLVAVCSKSTHAPLLLARGANTTEWR